MDDTIQVPIEAFDAFVFDLDGVVTDTARIHAAAWKKAFDDYLKKRASDPENIVPFDASTDYARYVDGMPRYDGVKNFLESRGIELPYGSPEDPPERETICGVGNKKNQMFQKYLDKDTIHVYDTTVRLIESLRENGISTAIVSSSKNCATILELVEIRDLFDVKVDGVDSRRLGLKGKPEPDIFLAAAAQLAVSPGRAVVVEDAISGVEAGRAGDFGLVIGVDRTDHAEALRKHGADAVVADLEQVRLIHERAGGV